MPAKRAVQSSAFNVTFEPRRQPCTKCRAPMTLARIESAKPGFDLHTFECSKCNNADQYIIEYGTASPWVLHVRASLQ
jgi:RNase P subunit RPR2